MIRVLSRHQCLYMEWKLVAVVSHTMLTVFEWAYDDTV